jgi:uncharacterized protein (TIGR02679 family)
VVRGARWNAREDDSTRRSRSGPCQLDDAVHGATGMHLQAWLEQSEGPLRDRPGERTARVERRSGLIAELRAHPIAAEPWFERWLDGITADGLLALAQRRGVLAAAVDIVQSAVHGGSDGRHRSLASVAAAATGDTKQLASTTVRSLVERALALAAGVPRPTASLDRRLLWRGFGVTLDDVSSDVLVLNVRARGDDRLARWLGDAADAGEPFRVTLRQLMASPLAIDAPVLWVCENPAVVMDVAAQLGELGGPLVCTEGVPTDACWTLLDRLNAPADVRVRADFDAAGLAIVGAVLARVAGSKPWRFDAPTYRRALAELGTRMRLPRSRGHVPASPWDPELAEAITADGRAVFEELLTDELVDDLRRGR